MIAHQHVGLAEIQSEAGLGELFDTLVVFENYPADRLGATAVSGGVRLVGVSGHDATHYALGLMAMPGEQSACGSNTRPTCLMRRASKGWQVGSSVCWKRL